MEESTIGYAGEDVYVIREIYNHAWQRINEKLAFCDNEWIAFWNKLHSAYLENISSAMKGHSVIERSQ
jgi:hypothetical protein